MAEKPAIRSSNDLCVCITQVFARSEINEDYLAVWARIVEQRHKYGVGGD